jgi:hypothetical protein
MHAGSVIETSYCTQQMRGQTQGVTLRAIHAAEINGIGKTRCCSLPASLILGHCVQYATVQFYVDGPSGPNSYFNTELCIQPIGSPSSSATRVQPFSVCRACTTWPLMNVRTTGTDMDGAERTFA